MVINFTSATHVYVLFTARTRNECVHLRQAHAYETMRTPCKERKSMNNSSYYAIACGCAEVNSFAVVATVYRNHSAQWYPNFSIGALETGKLAAKMPKNIRGKWVHRATT